jgi:hypothetical protein
MIKNIEAIKNELIRAAIEAINEQDRNSWYSVFSKDAKLFDEGKERDFRRWSDNEIFGSDPPLVTSILKVEREGFTVYCKFHSRVWGESKIYMTFTITGGHISKLDTGLVNY